MIVIKLIIFAKFFTLRGPKKAILTFMVNSY